jgi:branched-chain amino acid transport system permease protein
MNIFLQQAVNAISLGAIYALFALGYSLAFSVLGVLNLAHSAIFAWGGFLGVLGTQVLGFSVPLAFLFAMIGCGLLSLALEFVAFRPLRQRGAARIAQLISSIGAAILLVSLAQLLYLHFFNNVETYFPREIVPTTPIVIESLGIRIVPIQVIVLIVALILMGLLRILVVHTRTGQHMRAVAFSQRTAALLGVNVNSIYMLTFFLAGALGGAAGMFYGLVYTNVNPFIGQNVALIGLTAIVLGGMGSIEGAVLGGFLVAIIQTVSTSVGGSDYRDAFVFLLLFLILLLRPQGLLGQPEVTRA